MNDSDTRRGGPPAVEVGVVHRLDDIPSAAWDACAHSAGGADNPFVEHTFLRALETSGSVGARPGWLPCHLVATRGDHVVGVMPLYLKNNSYGEYIFDWAWADGARRAGLPYYPKLVGAVPFTPATGPRLLVRDDGGDEVRAALADAAAARIGAARAHSAHVLFSTEAEARSLAERGWIARLTHQFHWENAGYETFDDYLDHLGRKRRKEVRRERRKAAESGLDVSVVAGPDLTDADWGALHAFYLDTCSRKGAIPYLTPAFFQALRDTFAHRVVAVLARRGDQAIAGTLNFRRGRHLYGRYWGALEEHEALHFECCYYALIDFAIRERLTRFEAGAQGFHKVSRGFLARPTWSAHRMAHPGLHDAVAAYCADEARRTLAEIAWIEREKSPFRE